ncbi:hypothetical protein BX661DRAFT_188779 [Kickxella alabastrina]|uniref:uncharacterized protein n=1 Tax=Kickxella alabastrina TaxID=61397 RepID=UPI00221FF7CB|nr:uncharacterized protein BX661DRAFT_188779 [Kickxella alabastrina]KAI7820908.1 hypothetical protein BX661DRAFT_188779 [Kickxella alabastrina]
MSCTITSSSNDSPRTGSTKIRSTKTQNSSDNLSKYEVKAKIKKTVYYKGSPVIPENDMPTYISKENTTINESQEDIITVKFKKDTTIGGLEKELIKVYKRDYMTNAIGISISDSKMLTIIKKDRKLSEFKDNKLCVFIIICINMASKAKVGMTRIGNNISKKAIKGSQFISTGLHELSKQGAFQTIFPSAK